MENFTPSEYQQEIFTFIEKGVGNAVIDAKAGSGKTTTMVEGMKYIPQDQRALFVAFNKSICEELEKRLSKLKNVKVRTYHSLGLAILMENFRLNKDAVKAYKYTSYINKNIYQIAPASRNLSRGKLSQYKTNLKQLVDFARYNLAQSASEIQHLCGKYGIDLVADECEVVPRILEWGLNNLEEIDYADMVWIPVEKRLETRNNKFDFIFIDEAQDSSKMQQALIKKCFRRGARFIAVGDEHQCINAFAGADEEAFKMFGNEPNVKHFELPISYRCPKKIVAMAQRQIEGMHIEARPDAPEGTILTNVSPYEPKDGDLVLCRNTAHLMKLYMKYVAVNKKAYVKGRSIADKYKETVQSIDKDRIAWDMTYDGVIPRLYEKLFETIEKDMDLNGLDYEEALNTQKITDMIDTIKGIEILAEGITWKDELLNKIDVIFSDDSEEGVCLSTVHKAKGLEADNVFILCHSLMPSKHATKEWEIKQEKNLRYVAVTRTKNTLNFISEKEFPARLFDNDDVKSELDYKRRKMSSALNVPYTPMRDTANRTFQEEIDNDVDKIMNINRTGERVINEKRRGKVGGNKFAKFLK